MMKNIIIIRHIVIIIAMLLLSCTGTTASESAPRSDDTQTWRKASKTFVFECNDTFSFVARVDGETAWLFLPSKTLRLTREPSASGEKFSDSQTIFWSKGDSALLEYNQTTYRNCLNNRKRAIWEHAKLNGVDFRAVGNEPGWFMEIRDAESILFVADYGNSRYEFKAPQPVIDQKKRKTIYQTKAGEKNLTVVIEGRHCTDSMSGETFETTVWVQLDRRRYQGCGRALH